MPQILGVCVACKSRQIPPVLHVVVHVEVKDYSVEYFDCIAMFEVPYH